MAQLIVLRKLSLGRKNLITTPLLLKQQLNFSRFHRVCLQQRKADDCPDGGAAVPTKGTSHSEVSTDVSLGEKIKENTKTATYTAIILAGIGVTGIMFYAVLRELFSGSSSINIFSDALDRVKEDPRVQDALGTPIKGYGEETRRGRRQHVAHQKYERNGVPHMRMMFYVRGIRNQASVHLDTRKGPSGKIEYRYLFVHLDHYPKTTIIIEDNRAFDPSVPQPPLNSSNLELTGFSDK